MARFGDTPKGPRGGKRKEAPRGGKPGREGPGRDKPAQGAPRGEGPGKGVPSRDEPRRWTPGGETSRRDTTRQDEPRGGGPRRGAPRGEDSRTAPRRRDEARPAAALGRTPAKVVIPPGLEAIAGRNAVREALKAGKRVRRLLVTTGSLRSEAGAEMNSLAKRRGIAAEEFPRDVLDSISAENQGFVALAAPFEYIEWAGLLRRLKSAQKRPVVLVLDTVQDPQNLGTLLRTSESLGIDAVVLPKHRSVHVTPAVVRSSAGAVEHLPIAQVTNLVRALEDLKEAGLWIVGIEMDGETAPWDVDLSGPTALVLGGEDHGIGRLLKEKCDFLVRIPMSGKVNSLNAAVAGSMLLYEMARQRVGAESRQ